MQTLIIISSCICAQSGGSIYLERTVKDGFLKDITSLEEICNHCHFLPHLELNNPALLPKSSLEDTHKNTDMLPELIT